MKERKILDTTSSALQSLEQEKSKHFSFLRWLVNFSQPLYVLKNNNLSLLEGRILTMNMF